MSDFSFSHIIDSLSDLNEFHFIRPLWLLALLALVIGLFLLKKIRISQSPWQQFLPAHLSKVLLEQSDMSKNNGAHNTQHNTNNKTSLIKPFIIGLLIIIALAGPTWQRLPQPVYQVERGSVLIIDMSYSMYATDIKPNRLTRARFKAIDLLEKLNEGDIGLIAYAGDAFVISPLTQDIKNIELLLPSLTPDIMPKPGSNPYAALALAHEMLLNAGHIEGDIYWLTDDIDNNDVTDIYQWTKDHSHKLNILGVGTKDGAPIKLPSGELLKDSYGAIVVPKLPQRKLAALASKGHGSFHVITNDMSDINHLVNAATKQQALNKNQQEKQQEILQTGDQWQEQGPWLLIIVLPLMLSYFRRGLVVQHIGFILLPLALLLTPSSPISAHGFERENTNKEVSQKKQAQDNSLENIWSNLWQTPDQQAQDKFNQHNYQAAAQQFNDPLWQGSSHYKSGDYQKALEAFQQRNTSEALYNQGNALAQLKKFDEAIDAYKKALAKNPKLTDAKENIDAIEKLKKEQQQNQNNKQDKNKQDQENQEQRQDEQSENKDQNEQKNDQQKENEKQNSQENNQQQQQQQQQSNEAENSDKKQQGQQNSESEQQQKEQEKSTQEQQTDELKNKQQKGEQQAQVATDKAAQETEQKYRQLLNKVTDDPYLLLRNKMQLEYQKRQGNNSRSGVKKKW